MIAWGRAMISAMNGLQSEADTGLVRLFRIEYNHEYRHLKRMGYVINDAFVRSYLQAKSQ